ncbi:MAG: prolyl oligopeptidase family serine peptidase [Bacteroidota bacterium]
MKNLFLVLISTFAFAVHLLAQPSNNFFDKSNDSQERTYTLVIEGFDWGAAASKVILPVKENLTTVSGDDFEVLVKRSTDCAQLSPAEANGALKVLYAYVSDENGERIQQSNYITLALYAAPFEQINSPIKYFSQNPKCPGNRWVDFQLTILNRKTHQVWNQEKNRIIPLIDDFDLSGKFTHRNNTLTYASFSPKTTEDQRPLIIWLHGGGEGGTDPSIPLLANRAANYAAPEIQAYFDGAYVLVPQTPTFWMDNGKGKYTRGEVNDRYNESLMALIEDYVSRNPKIDRDRIYVGGCSNGGYMTLKLLMLRPDYFAAGFPSASAYHGKYLTQQDIEKIRDIPIWFIHSADDPVTKPEETVLPTYQKLMRAGAKNVHLSYFDHVVDITNQFGGADYHYLGHLSWIYSHANKCQLDYDGKPVTIDGKPVTLMGWLANQKR